MITHYRQFQIIMVLAALSLATDPATYGMAMVMMIGLLVIHFLIILGGRA